MEYKTMTVEECLENKICVYCGKSTMQSSKHPNCKRCGILLHDKKTIDEAFERKTFNPLTYGLSKDMIHCLDCKKL